MSEMRKEEKERLERMNNAFLYEVGYQHMNNICEEMDQLIIEYENIEIPQNLDDWFNNFNKERLEKQKKENQRKNILKEFRCFVAVVLILLIGTSVVTMSVEAFRIKLFNMFIETKNAYSEISFDTEEDYTEGIPEDWLKYYAMTYIPEGFTLTEAFKTGQSGYITYKYAEYYIMFMQGSLGLDSQIDTEDREIQKIKVGEYDAIMITNSEEIMLIWNNDDACFHIISNLDKDTILKIAENLKKIQK